MLFQGGMAYIEEEFLRRDVRVRGNKITELRERLEAEEGEQIINMEGKWLLPGFFDVHTHGRDGADFSDAPSKELIRIRRSYAACGVTSVLATTMTMEKEYSRQMMKRIRAAIEAEAGGLISGVLIWKGRFWVRTERGAMILNIC